MQEIGVGEVDYQVVEPKQDKTGSRFIFYAGDLISPLNKARDPRLSRGGIVVTNLTLSHTYGFIERCRIVEMRQAMQSSSIANVHPEQRRDWVPYYSIPVGIDPSTGETKWQTIGKDPNTGEHDGLLRRAVYPADDIVSLVSTNFGIVEMPVQNVREKNAAERFLFPIGLPVEFPDTIEKLKRYFELRRREAVDSFQSAVADAAIKSCDQILTTGQTVTAEAKSEYDRASKQAWAWTIPDEAVSFFNMLGAASPADLTRAKDGKLDKLVEATAQQAELMSRFLSASLPPVQPNFQPPTANQSEAVEPPPDNTDVLPPDSTETKTDVVFSVNERVFVGDREGIVTGKPGGRITVKFDSGESKTFEKGEVQKIQ